MAKRKFLETRRDTNPLADAIASGMAIEKEVLWIIRPGNKKQERVFTSPALTMVVSGANRSGKSYTAYSAAASRMLGQPLHDMDGNPIPLHFHVPKKGAQSRYWLIGYNHDHIGQTFYRMLFEPGMGGDFQIIYDHNQNKYVTWNANIPWHREQKAKRETAEALIPSRFIKEDSWTWHQPGGGQAKKCFASVELVNDAVIYAFPSTTPHAKQGDPIHGLLIDEDVVYGPHVGEYFARLMDFQGWAIWSAWPHDENYVLTSLIDGCKRAMEEGDPRFEHVHLTSDENPFFTDDTKDLAVARMNFLGDEEMVESRVKGIASHEGRMMYDFFPMQHGVSGELLRRSVPELDIKSPRGAIQAVYRKHNAFPDDWTRYFAIDPSTQRSAVVFGVVPPEEIMGTGIPPTLVIEDELVMKRATPETLAKAIKDKMRGRNYEAFVVDRNMGRQRHFAAGGANAFEMLADAFRKYGVYSRVTKEWCIPGCNVMEDRQTSVRDLLDSGLRGGLGLYVLLDTTPEFQKEINRYYKKKVEHKGVEVIEDTPENPRKFDVMAATEYLTHYVYELMKCKQHFVHPTAYQGDDGMASLARLAGGGGVDKDYIHLGAGASA